MLNIIWGLICIQYLPECPTEVFGHGYGSDREIIERHDEMDLHEISAEQETTALLNSSTLSNSSNRNSLTNPPPRSSLDGSTLASPPVDALDAPTAQQTRTLATISIIDAFKIPNVIGYALAFGFFKLINYAM